MRGVMDRVQYDVMTCVGLGKTTIIIFLRFLYRYVYAGSGTYIIMYIYVTHVFNRNKNPQYFSLWQNTVSIRF